jgi:nitroreductase
VPPELLDELLEATRWAPSGFNLQPTHFVVVTDPAAKARLYPACMKQRQILEAGATVVFTGDRRGVAYQFERILSSASCNRPVRPGRSTPTTSGGGGRPACRWHGGSTGCGGDRGGRGWRP